MVIVSEAGEPSTTVRRRGARSDPVFAEFVARL